MFGFRKTSCTYSRRQKVRYRLDNTDVVSTAAPAKEMGKDENGKSIYQEVQLTDCLDSLLGLEALEYACPSCSKKVQAFRCVANSRIKHFPQLYAVGFTRQTKFASLPEVLVVHVKKLGVYALNFYY